MIEFKIVPSASYAVYLVDGKGKVEGCYGIVGGDSIPGMLRRSANPSSLRFERVQ